MMDSACDHSYIIYMHASSCNFTLYFYRVRVAAMVSEHFSFEFQIYLKIIYLYRRPTPRLFSRVISRNP